MSHPIKKKSKKDYDPTTIKNFPNILMIIRVVLVPFLIFFLIQAGHYSVPGIWALENENNGILKFRIIATVIFIIAAITDRYDGIYARKHSQITNFGKIGDPIADKILTSGTMITLSIIANLPWAITIVILVREL
jgi:CDP-diacylglycerol--glycerol-3-phosphate 3-phosphatidyltransferase